MEGLRERAKRDEPRYTRNRNGVEYMRVEETDW